MVLNGCTETKKENKQETKKFLCTEASYFSFNDTDLLKKEVALANDKPISKKLQSVLKDGVVIKSRKQKLKEGFYSGYYLVNYKLGDITKSHKEFIKTGETKSVETACNRVRLMEIFN